MALRCRGAGAVHTISIEHKLKEALSSSERETAVAMQSLQQQVDGLDKRVSAIADRHSDSPRKKAEIDHILSSLLQEISKYWGAEGVIPDEKLAELERNLMQLGITQRRAQKLAPELRDVLLGVLAAMEIEQE